MPALKNLIGQKFGRLTVIERAPNQGRYVCWKCQCDCGNEKIIKSASLVSGRTKSCGCLYKETRHNSAKDLTNKKFGKLLALSPTDLRSDGKVLWKCKCDCGNIILVKSSDLIGNHRVSCGCKNKSAGESIIETILQENNIEYLFNKGFFQDLVSDTGTILRYDFIILQNNLPIRLIEFDGEQHFKELPIFKDSLKKIQRRDFLKNKYALEHNIPLVRIPYYELQNINLNLLFNDKYLIKEN